MPDVNNVPTKFGYGSSGDFFADVKCGTVAVDLPSLAAGVVASASASVPGMTAGHRVLVLPQAWVLNETVYIAAAIGIADGIQVTGTNPSAGTINATSQTCQFFAWRNP